MRDEEVALGDRLDGGVGRGEQEVAQRDHARQATVTLDHVDVVDALVLAGFGAQLLDDLLDGHVLGHGGDLRRHDAAGRLLLVAEQRADGARFFDAHEAQQGLGLVVGEVADDVGGVVRVHLGEECGGAALGEVVDDVGLQVVFELGDRVGGLLVVEVLEDLGALGGVELLEDVGDVGRVQLVEALVRDRELHLRQVAVEQVHVVPRDDVLGQLASDELGRASDRTLERRVDAAQDAARADFRTQEPELVARLGELEVVDAHDLHALRVDDLLAHEVAREQHLVGLQVAEADVGRGDVESHGVAVELAHELAPRQHERGLVGTLERE